MTSCEWENTQNYEIIIFEKMLDQQHPHANDMSSLIWQEWKNNIIILKKHSIRSWQHLQKAWPRVIGFMMSQEFETKIKIYDVFKTDKSFTLDWA